MIDQAAGSQLEAIYWQLEGFVPTDTPEDSPLWDAVSDAMGAIKELRCLVDGHDIIDDMCGIPEHRFCVSCNRSEMIDENHLILAPTNVNADQAVAYLMAAPLRTYDSSQLVGIVGDYLQASGDTGVSLGVLIGQAAHETGRFTSEWSAPPRHNPAGIGVTGRKIMTGHFKKPTVGLPAHHEWQWVRGRWESGVVFPNWLEAALAHAGRLLAYATPFDDASAAKAVAITNAGRWRMIPSAVRGCASTLAELGKARNRHGIGWASPGQSYGASIAAHVNVMAGI